MATFKNKNYDKKDTKNCTRVVFCEADKAPDENWVKCNPKENTLTQLYMQTGVRYFGYL